MHRTIKWLIRWKRSTRVSVIELDTHTRALPGGNVMSERNYPCDNQIITYFGKGQVRCCRQWCRTLIK